MWFYIVFTMILLGDTPAISHRIDVQGPKALQLCKIVREGFQNLVQQVMDDNPNVIAGVSECQAGGDEA